MIEKCAKCKGKCIPTESKMELFTFLCIIYSNLHFARFAQEYKQLKREN